MPRENKKRGRRGGQKRKQEEEATDDRQDTAKRPRTEDGGTDDDFEDDNHESSAANGDHSIYQNGDAPQEPQERAFFGMLDDDEQEYFKNAHDMLEADSFADPTERGLFLANVLREAEGKELKLACSQSCSRLMERLITLSSPSQLSKLFQSFSKNFLPLVQHRFASHCCEKLFIKTAPLVTEELLKKPDSNLDSVVPADVNEVHVSFENLFLHTLAELEGNIGFLMTDRAGSHALRVLLLVLSGDPLTTSSSKSILQSKRKENVATNGTLRQNEARLDSNRTVPQSFNHALEKLMVDCTTGLHTTGLRQMATHPIGSPIISILIRLELSYFGKGRSKDETSVLRTMLPDDPITQDTESAGFINGLNYDPIGSHVLETIIEFAPGKMFKHLYKEFWKDRMGSLARNEVAAYIVCKLLERLSKEDLIDAHELIIPHVPDLIEKNRIQVIKTLIQRCSVRNVDTQALAVALDAYYKTAEDDFDILRLLCLNKEDLEARHEQRKSQAGQDMDDKQRPSDADIKQYIKPSGPPLNQSATQRMGLEPSSPKVQGSVLAQAMLLVPGPLSGLIFDSMPMLSAPVLIEMARDPIVSRTLQATMTSTNASIIPRRKLVQQFYGSIGDMGVDIAASHVVDAIWEGTHGLAFIRERIAEELAENEAILRDSPCGRAVWKNWKMDLYKRRRNEWVLQSRNKASNDGFQSFAELDLNKKKMDGEEIKNVTPGSSLEIKAQPETKPKTPLELARERHAQKKQKSRDLQSHSSRSNGTASSAGKGTGANATVV